MIRSPRPRKAVSVSNSFHRQLTMNALAASAAGVGVLAMAPPAEGKIVYTPAHRTIAPHQTIPLDLNHDGKVDFRFKDTLSTTSASSIPDGFPFFRSQQTRFGGTKQLLVCTMHPRSRQASRLGRRVRSLQVHDRWRTGGRKAVPFTARASGTTLPAGI